MRRYLAAIALGLLTACYAALLALSGCDLPKGPQKPCHDPAAVDRLEQAHQPQK